ncbi:MAG: hypothetical protein COA42_09360 [Alteromonadaceae bacterium]|nr:MAG: hypothetical protein COA42_09360 [Alteromonadaceae bacterium]
MNGIFDQLTAQKASVDTSTDTPAGSTMDTEGDEANKRIDNEASQSTGELAHRTDQRLREASQELLRFGLLEESHKPNLYRIAQTHLDALNTILEPLDFVAHSDDIRGLVFLKVRKSDTDGDLLDEWKHPLVRKQRLTLEQSLLTAILRQYFIAHEQEAGTGAVQAMVAVEELIPQLQVYFGDTGSEAKERTRALQLLDQLKGHGLVSAPDAHERVTIRPMITHLANPENLKALLEQLKARAAINNETQEDSS